MHSPSLLDDLVARGLIAQSTPLPQLQQLQSGYIQIIQTTLLEIADQEADR